MNEATLSLTEVAQVIEASMGLHFPPSRYPDLERGLTEAARTMGFGTLREIVDHVARGELNRVVVEQLASHLTIGETYFFREPSAFTALEQQVIPELMQRVAKCDRKMRIWCAACCTGEEAYSLAILLNQIDGSTTRWTGSILATDINQTFLRMARTAIYKKWSFRDENTSIKERYFTPVEGGLFRLQHGVQKYVRFEYLNLAEDVYPSLLNGTNGLDLILCRNVLMYFSGEILKAVIDRLFECLVPGGYLVVGAAESSQQNFRRFQAVYFNGIVIYRKPEAAVAVEAARPSDPACFNAMPTMKRSARQPFLPTPSLPSPRQRRHSVTAHVPSTHTTPLLVVEARLAANRGELSTALGKCDEAIAANKLDPATHHLRATILDELGKQQEAIGALKTALYLAPDFALAHFTLANLELRRGNQREARRHFANAAETLARNPADEELPGADGLTAGRLREIALSLTASAERLNG